MKELDWPKPMVAFASNRNKSKYCYFHRDHGHGRENCIYLKEEIKRLRRQGFVAKYMKKDQGKEKVDDRPLPRVRVINMIVEEIAANGDLNFARKN